MSLDLYSRLGTRSRRALSRRYKHFNIPYNYVPRKQLIERLSLETGLPEDTIKQELMKERLEILKEKYGEEITYKDV